MPASSRVGENIAQPCALTTRVSQISEKGAFGSRLVTAIGRVIGTLELRRMVSGTFALCMDPSFVMSRFPAALSQECTQRPNGLKSLHLYGNATRARKGIPVVPVSASNR